MKVLEKADTLLGKISAGLLISLLGFLIVASFTQVVMRNLFSHGVVWLDPLLRHIVLWIALLGAIVATGERRHITIDALTKSLSPFWKKVSSVITAVASIVICYYLTSASYRFLLDEMEYGGTLILDIPIWIFQLIIPVGFGLMTFRFLVRFLEDSVKLVTGKAAGDD